MPEISRFFGIVIKMFFSDHSPPHFHAEYADHEALVTIETLEVLRGELPLTALALVLEWSAAHRDELRADWHRARSGQPLEPIEPLE
jgi:hypothetical protein